MKTREEFEKYLIENGYTKSSEGNFIKTVQVEHEACKFRCEIYLLAYFNSSRNINYDTEYIFSASVVKKRDQYSLDFKISLQSDDINEIIRKLNESMPELASKACVDFIQKFVKKQLTQK